MILRARMLRCCFRGASNSTDSIAVGAARQSSATINVHETSPRKYTLRGLEGHYTAQELLQLQIDKDPRFFKLRNRELPDEYWDQRRLHLNRLRSKRHKEKHKETLSLIDAPNSTPSPSSYIDPETPEEIQRKKDEATERRRRLDAALINGPIIAIDCSLANANNRIEVRSLAKQLQFCIASNKRTMNPVKIHFVGFEGPVKEFAVSSMGASNWKAHLDPRPAEHVFPHDNMVVLSPDAEEPLLEFDPEKTYIIGGIVDRTVQKFTSLRFATERSIEARRLPLEEHLGLQAVLNINDVFSALLAVYGGSSWKDALAPAVPARLHRRYGTSGRQVSLPVDAHGGAKKEPELLQSGYLKTKLK